MKPRLRNFLKHSLLFIGYGALGVVLTLLIFLVKHLDSRPDLEPWHLAELDEEYTAASEIHNFEQYLALEDRLFGQLDRLVYEQTGPAGEDLSNRFKRGSFTDPGRWPQNWNRSFELPADDPKVAVLLLHGLSDSPYSMRSIGEKLNQSGAHVLGLRIPGHGTAPSGLVSVRWQDMAAAVEMVVSDLASRNPEIPIHIVGYSNGAALAVHYMLESIEDTDLPGVDRLVLLSPEIGVTALAAFSVWQARLGHLFGLEKLAWNSIIPEYETFKYGSFAINAGDVSYRITAEIQRQITALDKEGLMSQVPPILAFSSVVDATVRAPDLVHHLFDRLDPGGHELVFYDVNRLRGLAQLYSAAPQEMFDVVREQPDMSFVLSLLTNVDKNNRSVVVRTWAPGRLDPTEVHLDLEWPADTFSLSHVALPFPADDPFYGGLPEGFNPGFTLGNLAFRGERGVLQVSSAAMLRQRWNPFFNYQEQRIREFLSLPVQDRN